MDLGYRDTHTHKGKVGSKGWKYGFRLQRHTHTHTKEKWVAKVANRDLGYAEKHAQVKSG